MTQILKANKEGTQEANIKFELLAQPVDDDLRNLERYQELEQRLASCEKFVGGRRVAQETIPNKISRLYQLLPRLDSNKVNELLNAFINFYGDVDTLYQKKKELKLEGNQIKHIEEAYSNLEKVLGTGEDLGVIIERLETLQLVNKEAHHYGQTLKDCKLKQQNEVVQLLAENQSILERTVTEISGKYEKIATQIQSLDTKISQLPK